MAPPASRTPPTTSICHSSIAPPRSQRRNRRSRRRRAPARSGRPASGPDRSPNATAPGRRPGPRGLVHEPTRSPVGVASAGLEHPDLDGRGHLMRAPRRSVRPVDQPSKPLVLVPTQPPMHRLARHTEPAQPPPRSGRRHGSPPAPPDTAAPRHSAPPAWSGVCNGSGGASVMDQAEPRHPSAGAETSRVRRSQTVAARGPAGTRTPNLRIKSPGQVFP